SLARASRRNRNSSIPVNGLPDSSGTSNSANSRTVSRISKDKAFASRSDSHTSYFSALAIRSAFSTASRPPETASETLIQAASLNKKKPHLGKQERLGGIA